MYYVVLILGSPLWVIPLIQAWCSILLDKNSQVKLMLEVFPCLVLIVHGWWLKGIYVVFSVSASVSQAVAKCPADALIVWVSLKFSGSLGRCTALKTINQDRLYNYLYFLLQVILSQLKYKKQQDCQIIDFLLPFKSGFFPSTVTRESWCWYEFIFPSFVVDDCFTSQLDWIKQKLNIMDWM